MTLEGGCFCGEIRYRIDGAPKRVEHCHCVHCRRTSGAPFLTWGEFAEEAFVYTRGGPARYESRRHVVRECCGKCGTQLTYRSTAFPGEVDVTVGSLDDPAALEPEMHIWCERKLPWLRFDDGLPQHPLRAPSNSDDD